MPSPNGTSDSHGCWQDFNTGLHTAMATLENYVSYIQFNLITVAKLQKKFLAYTQKFTWELVFSTVVLYHQRSAFA